MTEAINRGLSLPLILFVAACGGSRTETPTSPTPSVPVEETYQPDAPTPGLDGSIKRLVDGASNPMPVTVRMTSVHPKPGSVLPENIVHQQWGVHFVAEFCMDPVPNPRNSVFLNEITVRPMWSQNGVTPLTNAEAHIPPGAAFQLPALTIPNGTCVTWRRIPVDLGGTPGQQFIFFYPGRHLMFIAAYGGAVAPNLDEWPNACPAPADIRNRPVCIMRTVPAYDLGYQWSGVLS